MLYTLPSLCATAIALGMAIYCWHLRSSGRWLCLIFLVSTAAWSFGSAMKLLSTDLPAALFWVNIQSIGIAVAQRGE